jgi:hypothetical protein
MDGIPLIDSRRKTVQGFKSRWPPLNAVVSVRLTEMIIPIRRLTIFVGVFLFSFCHATESEENRKYWIFPSIKTGNIEKFEFSLTNYLRISDNINVGPLLTLRLGSNSESVSMGFGGAGTAHPGNPIELFKNSSVGYATVACIIGFKFLDTRNTNNKYDPFYYGYSFSLGVFDANYLFGSNGDRRWQFCCGL